MTVREAVQSIVGLTGSLQVCGCTAGSSGFSLAQGAITALNRAMQSIYMSPLARQMARETVTVTFPTTAPVDLETSVLHVVGPAKWAGREPLPLATTESEFYNYYQAFGDHPAHGELYDTITVGDFHDVSNGGTFWTLQMYLPLWDDRAVLVWFDNAAGSYGINLEAATTAGSQSINRRVVSVRVVLPTNNTQIPELIDSIVAAINRSAGEFLEAVRLSSTQFRLFRRRPADLGSWSLYNPLVRSFSIAAGPRAPVIAWAEELKASSGNDPSRVRLHILPATAGTVELKVIKEPAAFTMASLDCDGDGTASTVILAAHQFSETLVLPLARMYFAQDQAAFLSPQAAAMMESFIAAGNEAREALGLAPAGMSQQIQRSQTTFHAHP